MLKLLALAGPAVSVDPLTDALWPGQALEAVWAELEPGDSSVTVNVTFVYIDGRIIELVSATDQLATIGWTVLTALIFDAVKKALDRQDDEDRRDDE